MSYFDLGETKARLEKVRSILRNKHLDAALIYYDELNIANGWYLTGWCPQFEKGCDPCAREWRTTASRWTRERALREDEQRNYRN